MISLNTLNQAIHFIFSLTRCRFQYHAQHWSSSSPLFFRKAYSLVWGFQGWGSSNTGMRYCQPTLSRDTEASCYTKFCSQEMCENPGSRPTWCKLHDCTRLHGVTTSLSQSSSSTQTHAFKTVRVSNLSTRRCKQENLTNSYAPFKAVQMVRSYNQHMYLQTFWLIQSSNKQSK